MTALMHEIANTNMDLDARRLKRGHVVCSGAHTTHPGEWHAVYSRNGARASVAVLDQPTGHLKHWAHYFDAIPAARSMHGFAVENYLAAADSVGAWG